MCRSGRMRFRGNGARSRCSATIASSIQTAGRVALYGILFDFNKADVKAESAPTLAEIAKHLKSGPGLKLLVAGHTDSVGGFEFNRDLSARRAKAVVTELTGKYGISNDRLFPFGVSFAARSRRTTRRRDAQKIAASNW